MVCFCLMIQIGESKSCLLYNCCLVAALKSIHCLLAIRFIFPSGLLQIIDVLGVDWKEIEREVMSGIIMIICGSVSAGREKLLFRVTFFVYEKPSCGQTMQN